MEKDTWLKKLLKALRMNESIISTLLGGLVVVVVGVLIYNYFSSINKTGDIDEELIEGEVHGPRAVSGD